MRHRSRRRSRASRARPAPWGLKSRRKLQARGCEMSAAPVIRSGMEQVSEPVPSEVLLRDVPLPVVIRPAAPLTDEELLAFCSANPGLDIESDADGSIRVMTPAGPESSELNLLLASELMVWARRNGSGAVFGPDLGVRF